MNEQPLDREQYERRLQQLWDARLDPADDPGVQTFLLQHPELLDGFAAQRQLVDLLPAMSPGLRVRVHHRRHLLVLATVATAAASVLLASLFRAAEPAQAGAPAAAATAPGRILDAALEIILPTSGRVVGWQQHQVLFDSPTAGLEILHTFREQR
jgi:hypothetical protein